MHKVCEKCKLHEQCSSPFMDGSGSSVPDVLFIGEAPGAYEDEQGKPFVGKSGQLLRQAIDVLELENCRFTNTIRCRPPDNRTPTAREINYCSDLLLQEIKETTPPIIVLLGNAPLKSVLGESGISNWNGVVIERNNCIYIPAYHPAFILRNGARDDLLSEWFDALENIVEALNGKSYVEADSHYQYHYPEYVDQLEVMRDEILANPDELIAYDIESKYKDELAEGNKILSVALANSEEAWSFPIDHDESFCEVGERIELLEILKEILTTAKIATHTKFDCKLTRRLLNIDFQQYGDTIHLSRLLNAHMYEHGLKRLAGLHLHMYDYDKDLQDYIAAHPECDYNRGGNYGNVPLDILLPYGGKDVHATWLLHDELYRKLSEEQKVFYEELVVPADYVLGKLESNGFKLDYELIQINEAVYEMVKNNYYVKLLQDADTIEFVMAKQRELDIIWEERSGKTTRELKRQLFKFNPNSSQQMIDILYERKQYEIPALTPKGKPSIKKDYLKEILFDSEDRDNCFLENYMNWKLLSTILSKTYKPMMDIHGDWYSHDGRVRCNFVLGGAKTGRTSSSQPNLQNIPTPEKEPGTILQYRPAKDAFTHTWKNGCLCMLDYAGMELRVMASVAGIQGMVDVFNRDGDVHRYVSGLIYKMPEADITKFQRYRGKWCNWSLLFRGNWWTLYRLYRINGLTEDEAKRITNLYFAAFPELLTYHESTILYLKEHKHVKSPFGRVLQLPAIDSNSEAIRNDVIRTAVNMPIQGTASDILMAAMIIIDHYMVEEKFKSMLVNTVHDSLIGDIYPGELDDFVALATDVMENIVDYASDFMPNMNFDWLRVPLKADVDTGSHYGSYGEPKQFTCSSCEKFNFELYREVYDKDRFYVDYRCDACSELVRDELDNDASILAYNNELSISINGAVGASVRRPRLI